MREYRKSRDKAEESKAQAKWEARQDRKPKNNESTRLREFLEKHIAEAKAWGDAETLRELLQSDYNYRHGPNGYLRHCFEKEKGVSSYRMAIDIVQDARPRLVVS